MKNIQDEFQIFRDELKKLKIDVTKIVKVGNGSMDFHEVFYKSPRYEDVKTVYVQRHNLDNLIDSLTIAIDNDELKLNNENTFKKEIESKIQNSHTKLLALIYNFKG